MHRLTERLLIGLFLAASGGAAAMATEVVVSTTACGAIPPDSVVAVIPADDSPLNMEIAGRLAETLHGTGYRTGRTGPLELRYHAAEQGQPPTTRERSLGRLDGSGGGVSLNLNIWSNTKDSVIGGRRAQQRAGNALHLVVEMELDRVADRDCIWRGEAAASLVGWQRGELAKRLVEILVGEIGGDTGQKRLELR